MTKEDIHSLIADGEGETLDFKRSMDKKHAKTIVSFANAVGGRLLIGVEDTHEITGSKLSNDAKSKIESIARECDPPVLIEIEEVAMGDNTFVTVLHVPTSEQKPHRSTEGYFLRRGASSQKMTTEELVHLLNQEGRLHFDSLELKGLQWEDIFDMDMVQRFRSYLGAAAAALSDLHMLQAIGALSEAGHPTNAGILFFALSPQDYIPQSLVHCVAYDTSNKSSIRDRQNLNTGLLNILDDTLGFLKKHLFNARVIDGLKGVDKLEIPEPAIREAIVNALIHRDYNIDGGHIMIEVFPDRVDISSPGSLPLGLDVKDFGKRSVVRNRLMADIMLRTPYMEKLGSGIDRIKSELNNAGFSGPAFDFTSFTSITLYRNTDPTTDPVTDPITDPIKSIQHIDDQMIKILDLMIDPDTDPITDPIKQRYADILKLLMVKGIINRRQIAEELDVPKDTVKRDLTFMRSNDIITFKGPNRTGGYVFTDKVKEQLK